MLKLGKLLLRNGIPPAMDEKWIIRIAAIALLCGAVQLNVKGSSTGLAERELLAQEIVSQLALRGREAGLAAQYVDFCFESDIASFQTFADIHKSLATPGEHVDCIRLMFAACSTTSAGTTLSQDQSDRIQAVANLFEVEPSLLSQIRAETVATDTLAYEILGVSPSATDEEIKSVYRRLAAQFHPDTGGELEKHQRDESREAFLRIKQAFNKIMEERGGYRRE
jgi:hypothetical protein